ncbi:hypothetical protein VNO78_06366 [Psophocarpus tetragonolobus]|uniref:Uncharacterized protein n=1 Tax=Psophocarpus tetragonolobus TaxID=3891 RepID=A0AAN9STI3_PSOTE
MKEDCEQEGVIGREISEEEGSDGGRLCGGGGSKREGRSQRRKEVMTKGGSAKGEREGGFQKGKALVVGKAWQEGYNGWVRRQR